MSSTTFPLTFPLTHGGKSTFSLTGLIVYSGKILLVVGLSPIGVSRQAQVPGLDYMNETGTLQAQIPGSTYMNEGGT